MKPRLIALIALLAATLAGCKRTVTNNYFSNTDDIIVVSTGTGHGDCGHQDGHGKQGDR